MRMRHGRILSLAAALAAMLSGLAFAHEIPAGVNTYIFVKPAGSHLQVLVRVPLAVVRDVVYPEIEGGFLDIEALRPRLPELASLWLVDSMQITGDGRVLDAPRIAGTQLSFFADKAFRSFESALSRIEGSGLDNNARVVWNQLWFDVWIEYPIRSPASAFTLRTGFERLAMRVACSVRFLPDTTIAGPGAERAYSLHMQGGSGDIDALPLDPRWHQAALRFAGMGMEHILEGIDHLLFLGCVVIPIRRLRPLLVVVTAFTLAHSITMVSAALGFVPDALWFPPLIEALIALSIVTLAIENVVGAAKGTAFFSGETAAAPSWQWRWILVFAFGLVHGFGFSFALRESLQFAGGHLAASLAAFNVGVELGQFAVLLVLVPMLNILFRFALPERVGTIVLSTLIAHTGWHWLLERAELLRSGWAGG
ncbi:MAG: HupE/UreJ family protein [Bryobacterales bacterium]|nr:HupE/UreJ family protein [Bryobacterales bacterium]